MELRNKKKNNRFAKLLRPYRLTLQKEEDPEEQVSFRFTTFSALLLTLITLMVFTGVITFLLAATSLGNFLPGYMDRELRSEMVKHALRVDSIAENNLRREIYLENVLAVLRGEESADSIPATDAMGTLPLDSLRLVKSDSLLKKGKNERAFTERFEQEEKYNLSILGEKVATGRSLFYAPVRGVVTLPFDPEGGRTGVEVKCARNSSVASPMEGTVIFAAHTIDSEYVMQIQHPNDFVSVFRYLGSPMREVSSPVTGGSVIATVAQTGATREQPRIYYELWYKGKPLNPEEYINF